MCVSMDERVVAVPCPVLAIFVLCGQAGDVPYRHQGCCGPSTFLELLCLKSWLVHPLNIKTQILNSSQLNECRHGVRALSRFSQRNSPDSATYIRLASAIRTLGMQLALAGL